MESACHKNENKNIKIAIKHIQMDYLPTMAIFTTYTSRSKGRSIGTEYAIIIKPGSLDLFSKIYI